ncbi:hypothetical protein OBK04_11935 [Empedobacter falsenii]
MYSEQLEKLIELALSDGELTEKEREVLYKKAQAENIELDEFEMVLDAKLFELKTKNKMNISAVVEKISDSLPTMDNVKNVFKSAKNTKVFDNFHNKITGRQAFLDHKKAKKVKSESENKIAEYRQRTEEIQQDLNKQLEQYGQQKLETLKRTLGVFLTYLDTMEQKYKENYYELMDECHFPKSYVAELQQLSMNNTEMLKTAATSGSFASVAILGVPFAVKGAVGAWATASTGTAITGLYGAAKTSAIMAWLGGGSIATGGGGMAAGTVVLAGITYTATGVVALASAGLVASGIYAKKLTEAEKFSADVDIACEKMEISWIAMKGIKQRIIELMDVTYNVYEKCVIQLSHLKVIVSNFDSKSREHLLTFQKTALLIKSMSELARTPLFGDDMNLSMESENVIVKTKKILNTEL